MILNYLDNNTGIVINQDAVLTTPNIPNNNIIPIQSPKALVALFPRDNKNNITNSIIMVTTMYIYTLLSVAAYIVDPRVATPNISRNIVNFYKLLKPLIWIKSVY